MMFDDLLEQATGLKARGEPFALATVVACKPPTSAKPGAKAIVTADGTFVGWVGGSCAQPVVTAEALKALQEGKPRLVRLTPDPAKDPAGPWQHVYDVVMSCQSEGSLEIYIEPHLPRPQLVLIGRSPMAHALAHLGRFMGFAVTVSDPEATREAFPDADAVVPALDELPGLMAPGAIVVVATMGHYDEEALGAALSGPAGYVALIASEKRGRAVLEYLRSTGVPDDTLGRVRCPAGLPIGAVQPEEIALSIMAEIVQIRAHQVPRPPEGARPPAAEQSLSAVDPVCGMTVIPSEARYTAVRDGTRFYFCCLRCKETFEREADVLAAAEPP
jgi:xanthine dehydrogenase accessory factor